MNEVTIALQGFVPGTIITSEENKLALIAAGKLITQVTTPEEQIRALEPFRDLKAIITETEAARKLWKAPVLALGKKIDDTAAKFIADAEKEKLRIEGLLNHYQQVLDRQRREAEQTAELERQRLANEAAAAVRLQEEAQRKQQAADLAAQQAESMKGKKKEQAEAEATRLADEARKLSEAAFAKELEIEDAPAPMVVAIEQPKGVSAKEVLDYVVNGRNEFEQHKSLVLFAAAHPHLVKIEVKRRDLLEEIANGRVTQANAPGLTIAGHLKTSFR